jgi:DNA topoisomerase-1
VIKDFGEHPSEGGRLTVRSGRYGPYVNHGKLNATLPRSLKPEDVTAEQAVALLAEKAAKGATGKPAAGRGRRSSRGKAGAKAPAELD